MACEAAVRQSDVNEHADLTTLSFALEAAHHAGGLISVETNANTW